MHFSILTALLLASACLVAAPAAVAAPSASTTSQQPASTARPHAAPPPPAAPGDGPRALGRFDDWTAASHLEAGQNVCYAFTVANQSSPTIAGRERVVMTIAERPSGRDSVAIAVGFAFVPGAEASLIVDQTAFPFYTAQRSAFARDGRATVAALLRARSVQSRSPGPRGVSVVDSFSLRGLRDAYSAAVKACPAR